jgi:hypothetical protein
MAPESTLAELERYARLDGVTLGHVVREALEEYVAGRAETTEAKLPSFVGMFASGETDVAERAEEILREELPRFLESEVNDADNR